MLNIVWFKRDLRISDHEALYCAAEKGPVLPLYIVEPELWQQADASLRQWLFIRESLLELSDALHQAGQGLIIRQGNAHQVFSELMHLYPVEAVYSHQETGNRWTFDRDRRISRLLKDRDIPWHEYRQHAVVRGRFNRDHWNNQWHSLMDQKPFSVPKLIPLDNIHPGEIPRIPLAIADTRDCPARQLGGRSNGLRLLSSFLDKRGKKYHFQVSRPATAVTGCSRLSPHLSYGTVSLRELMHAVRLKQKKLVDSEDRTYWKRALSAFESRLHWHCHFIQKLESEPRIEFENMQQSMQSLDRLGADSQAFKAWRDAQTGWPLVDACMRSLQQTGWLNFRMRAMLMSVASYQLWLDWRAPAHHLARLFVDYEPGIHYPQVQMQSGTTGINTLRIYNPVKQSLSLDPSGHFIKKWLPELAGLNESWIHTPWLMPLSMQQKLGVLIGKDYPAPLVDHEIAAKTARSKISRLRQQDISRQQAGRIMEQHGSRKKQLRRNKATRHQRNTNLPYQQDLFANDA